MLIDVPLKWRNYLHLRYKFSSYGIPFPLLVIWLHGDHISQFWFEIWAAWWTAWKIVFVAWVMWETCCCAEAVVGDVMSIAHVLQPRHANLMNKTFWDKRREMTLGLFWGHYIKQLWSSLISRLLMERYQSAMAMIMLHNNLPKVQWLKTGVIFSTSLVCRLARGWVTYTSLRWFWLQAASCVQTYTVSLLFSGQLYSLGPMKTIVQESKPKHTGTFRVFTHAVCPDVKLAQSSQDQVFHQLSTAGESVCRVMWQRIWIQWGVKN